MWDARSYYNTRELRTDREKRLSWVLNQAFTNTCLKRYLYVVAAPPADRGERQGGDPGQVLGTKVQWCTRAKGQDEGGGRKQLSFISFMKGSESITDESFFLVS